MFKDLYRPVSSNEINDNSRDAYKNCMFIRPPGTVVPDGLMFYP